MNNAAILLLAASTLGVMDQHDRCLDRPGVVYKIARKEGWYKRGTLPQRLNNPGSLVFAHQRGATRHKSGFAQFGSSVLGWNALQRDVENKLQRKKSLRLAWAYL